MKLLIITLFAALSIVDSDETRHLAKERACFDAVSFNTDSTFPAPFDGDIVGIELEYVSGGVTCKGVSNNVPLTNWGCIDTKRNKDTVRVQMIKAEGGTIYPTPNTEGASCTFAGASNTSPCDAGTCTMTDYSANSDTLRFVDTANPIAVSVNDVFSLQYTEACFETSTSDNSGTACADVYFIYKDLHPCVYTTCEDSFVCDADADLFETVTEYPCKRDCDLFPIDEYLDQCSAMFPSAIEVVTQSISQVDESVQKITDTDIPAVTARVQANEDAVSAIQIKLESVSALLSASSAQADTGLFDANGSSFAQQGSLFAQYKDELIGALIASNIIAMVGFTCYILAGRCGRSKYVVVDEAAVEDEKLRF